MPLDRAAAGKRASGFSKLYETRKVKFSKEKRKMPLFLAEIVRRRKISAFRLKRKFIYFEYNSDGEYDTKMLHNKLLTKKNC